MWSLSTRTIIIVSILPARFFPVMYILGCMLQKKNLMMMPFNCSYRNKSEEQFAPGLDLKSPPSCHQVFKNGRETFYLSERKKLSYTSLFSHSIRNLFDRLDRRQLWEPDGFVCPHVLHGIARRTWKHRRMFPMETSHSQ
jgi:hypothetical protein